MVDDTNKLTAECQATYLVGDNGLLGPDQSGAGISIYVGEVEGLDVQAGDSVLIPTTLTVSGNCAANCTSDARLKKNVAPLHDALGRLLRLRGVTFEWIDPSAQCSFTLADSIERFLREHPVGRFTDNTVRGMLEPLRCPVLAARAAPDSAAADSLAGACNAR